jgi:hypothetical protein
MRDRIERALDAELPEAELTPDEVRELRGWREAIAAGLASLPDDPAPDVSRAVMRRIADREPLPAGAPPEAGPRRALAAVACWLWTPRPFAVRLRPAFGLAAAVALAALAFGSAARWVATRAPAPVLVQFRLGSADASRVSLVGDFTGWRAQHELHELAPGVWSVVIPLAPGVYDYAFVIDGGAWRLDPLAPQVGDGFGGANSRVTVLAPGEGARVL